MSTRARFLAQMLAITALVFGAARARGQAPAPRPPVTGFLSPSQMPDVVRIVPAAPTTGDSRFTADMAVYSATRALEGSPRWAIAQSDDELGATGLFKAFRCALGVTLTGDHAPLVTSLLTRATADARRASNVLKDFYQHQRPYQIVDGPVCVSPETKANLSRNPDYPSGHTTASWEAGLVLSQVAPEQATAILSRARAFGESRIVCGVHNLSAVEAGWMTATTVFAAQQSSGEFLDAVRAARAEFTAVRRTGTIDQAACAAETALLAKDPF